MAGIAVARSHRWRVGRAARGRGALRRAPSATIVLGVYATPVTVGTIAVGEPVTLLARPTHLAVEPSALA